jgi:hemoglobin
MKTSFFPVGVFALAMTLVAGGWSTAGAQESPGPTPPTTLYLQLGGYDALAAVTDDLIGRLASDPKLAQFFIGLNDEHKALLRQRFVEFLCAKSGGPCIYTGRDMKTAHAGLHITEDQWNAALADFAQTEDKFNVPQPLREQVGQLFAQIKSDIVTAP